MKHFVFVAMFAASTVLAGLDITGFESVGNERVALTAKLDQIPLQRLGTGIRSKTVVIVSVNVYRAVLFGSDPQFVRNEEGTLALDSLQHMQARAMHLTLLRDLTAKQIAEGFEASLKENNVTDSEAMRAFRSAVLEGGDVKKGDTVSVAVDRARRVLVCQQGQRHFEIAGDDTFFRDVFSIWLGKWADSGLQNLRTKLIMGS